MCSVERPDGDRVFERIEREPHLRFGYDPACGDIRDSSCRDEVEAELDRCCCFVFRDGSARLVVDDGYRSVTLFDPICPTGPVHVATIDGQTNLRADRFT